MQRAPLRDGWLAFERVGTGRPLVCLHGGMGIDSGIFRIPAFERLTQLGQAITWFDQRGHGESSTLPETRYSHAGWASDLRDLKAHLGWSRCALLGHSYGGFIALEHAVRWPQEISHLILVSTSAGPVPISMPRAEADADVRAIFAARWPQMLAGADKHWDIFEQIRFSASPFNAAFQRELPKYDLRSRLDALTMPALLLVGEHDQYREPMEWLAGRLPRAELRVLSDTAHVPFVESPEEFVAEVARFLAETT